MKILITGSSGMLGQALCRELAAGHEVIGLDIGIFKILSNIGRVDFFLADITDAKFIIGKIIERHPDIIIHCAAYTNVDSAEKERTAANLINAEGTKSVAAAARQINAFLIYISTDYVFDGKKDSPYNENDKPNPVGYYGETKLKGEIAVKNILDEYLIIRTSWLYGKGGRNFIGAILDKAKTEKTIKVVNDQIGSPTYADDLAKAISYIIGHRLLTVDYRLVHITNSCSCSWYEFAKEIINTAGIKGVNVVPILSQELNRPAKRPKMSVLDNGLFRKIYGRGLPHWKDALKRYLKQ
ncbi:MAG: dTDP-4-dehydrorhamnose reductase [Candidatus Omnitrophica bacterium]|nr:dTDP-4-dehydrorhamnose reductase [Candidatus Omnitrophota bacterium]